MFGYAKGRKISVLRTFRPLYNRIEAPADILYIALYHAEHKDMWPSLHGMISRHIDESNQHVCDFVVEVDKMRSQACFDATLPYVEVLRDFGIYARLKFSGHVSAHVIIPGETFPPPADVGNIRRQFATVSGVQERLMNYVQKIVKQPDKLDRYFLRSSHFLRLVYSMNERTGLVSVPIEIDEFEKFSWRNAQPYRVKVLEDWWGLPPPDAQDRVREFLEFASRRYHTMQSEEITERRQNSVNQRAKRDRAMPVGKKQPVAAPHATKLSIRAEDYQRMLTTAQEEWIWCESFLEHDGLKESLLQLCTTADVMSLQGLATQHGYSLNELWRVWHWLGHLPALEHYAKSEVQQSIFQASQSRRLRPWGEEAEFQLKSPEDMYPLAVSHHKSLGTHEYPAFLMSVGRYEPEAQFPYGYDLVIDVDGRGRNEEACEVATELGKGLSAQGLAFTAYHAGMPHIYLWVQLPLGDELQVGEIPHRYAGIIEETRKFMRHAGFSHAQWRALKRDEFAPVPHGLNLYTGIPCRREELGGA
jgi:hypothetical protein